MTWKSENKAPPWEECDLLLCVAVLSGLKWGFWIPNIISLRLLLVWVRVKNPAFFFPPSCHLFVTFLTLLPLLLCGHRGWSPHAPHGSMEEGLLEDPDPSHWQGGGLCTLTKPNKTKPSLLKKKTFLCHYEKKSSLLNESQMYWIKSDTGLKKAQ